MSDDPNKPIAKLVALLAIKVIEPDNRDRHKITVTFDAQRDERGVTIGHVTLTRDLKS